MIKNIMSFFNRVGPEDSYKHITLNIKIRFIMIELSNVSKSFGSIRALENVSLEVARGEIVGFLGQNGSGKTTTLDILTNCLQPDSGKVHFDGACLASSSSRLRRQIGYVPDEPILHLDMTVQGAIQYCGRLWGLNGRRLRDRVHAVIELLGLWQVLEKRIRILSKGVKKRVSLAQAIVHEPSFLVLDEPTEGLDPIQIVHVRDFIKSLRGKCSVLFSSHLLSEVEIICDRVIFIKNGKIVDTYESDKASNVKSADLLYRVSLKGDGQLLVDILEKKEGVQIIKYEKNSFFGWVIELSVQRNLSLSEVYGAFEVAKVDINELKRFDMSLEDMFMNITSEGAKF